MVVELIFQRSYCPFSDLVGKAPKTTYREGKDESLEWIAKGTLQQRKSSFRAHQRAGAGPTRSSLIEQAAYRAPQRRVTEGKHETRRVSPGRGRDGFPRIRSKLKLLTVQFCHC